MKPGEEMHSSVEEVDLDPCDLYLDLGALIVEGRIPGLTDRGFGEGPHCPPAASVAGGPQSRHHCHTEAPECQRYEQMQKHMLLLWKNSIPMSIEVLLYPGCCVGSAPIQNVDTSSMPDMSYIMLEQWTVHMLPRRVPDASISPRGLMQAIRSFLYFSQLCAWFSLTGGKSPQNVHYRVCVPGEAFSSRFSSTPNCHAFPIANVGRNAAMKVVVKSQPRCGEIPVVLCHKHLSSSLPAKAIKPEGNPDCTEEDNEEPLIGAEGEIIDGILPTEAHPNSRTSSPADSMLGESLLDPPNSLCMYPKRYQSPSRCGSPSLEVPEHLMFGKGAAASRESRRQRLSSDVPSRSRALHRPVFQRVLEKNLSDAVVSSTKKSDNQNDLDDMLRTLNEVNPDIDAGLRNYLCFSSNLKEVSKAEMESVLQRLRNNRCSRGPYDESSCPYPMSTSNKYSFLNKQLSLDESLPRSTLPSAKIPLNINKPGHQFPSNSSKPFHPIQKLFPTHKSNRLSTNSKQPETEYKYRSQHSRNHLKTSLNSQKDSQDIVANRKPCLDGWNSPHAPSFVVDQSDSDAEPSEDPFAPWANKNPVNKSVESSQKNQWITDPRANRPTYREFSRDVLPAFAGVNIKKCGALLQSLTLQEELIDERRLEESPSPTQRHLRPKLPDPLEDLDSSNHVIPSAEEKAQFRRSLDSATCLVFHQKSGLPLTSSPAPIRKSGTCFDFDSSLTSVSAIKRALFEKAPENDVREVPNTMYSSTSAPSSMTNSSLLGTFEESVLNGRLEPVSTVEGFTAEIGASGSFCPRHITLPVTIFFYTLQDIDRVTSPYLGHINLNNRDYHVPKRGTVQVTLFNPHRTVVKMFVVRYDLSDMPPNCQTFLRQRTLYMPSDASENDGDAQKWLRYLIHLRFASSKSGRIYLHTDIRMIIFRKSDLDAAMVHGQRPYELRSFIQGPIKPKFSPRKS